MDGWRGVGEIGIAAGQWALRSGSKMPVHTLSPVLAHTRRTVAWLIFKMYGRERGTLLNEWLIVSRGRVSPS
jgi:hypothetical protein